MTQPTQPTQPTSTSHHPRRYSTEAEAYIYDNSALATYNTCPRKYYLLDVLGITSLEEKPALTYGSAMHEALYHYYKGDDTNTCLKAFIKRAKMEGSSIPEEYNPKEEYSVEWGVFLLEKYFQARPIEKEPWEVIENSKGEPYLEVGFFLDAGTGIYAGKIDMLVRHKETGLIHIIDHKTTKRILNQYYWDTYDPNNQVTGYFWAVR